MAVVRQDSTKQQVVAAYKKLSQSLAAETGSRGGKNQELLWELLGHPFPDIYCRPPTSMTTKGGETVYDDDEYGDDGVDAPPGPSSSSSAV
jgi:hypothetical protein